MTQWEQMKNEYREIPVPADGPQQVLQAMAEAKRKRNRWKNLTRYGSVAAAALVVVLLIPGMFLFSGGFGASTEDCAYPESERATESASGAAEWFSSQSVKNMAPASDEVPNSSSSTAAPEYGPQRDAVLQDAVAEESASGKPEAIWTDRKEAISREIIRQMEERMQENGETYYIRSEEYPQGFELLSEDQDYYINEEGRLVFVFASGSIAPEEQGTVEFLIPAEVFSP